MRVHRAPACRKPALGRPGRWKPAPVGKLPSRLMAWPGPVVLRCPAGAGADGRRRHPPRLHRRLLLVSRRGQPPGGTGSWWKTCSGTTSPHPYLASTEQRLLAPGGRPLCKAGGELRPCQRPGPCGAGCRVPRWQRPGGRRGLRRRPPCSGRGRRSGRRQPARRRPPSGEPASGGQTIGRPAGRLPWPVLTLFSGIYFPYWVTTDVFAPMPLSGRRPVAGGDGAQRGGPAPVLRDNA